MADPNVPERLSKFPKFEGQEYTIRGIGVNTGYANNALQTIA
jgi:hypothetical protein